MPQNRFGDVEASVTPTSTNRFGDVEASPSVAATPNTPIPANAGIAPGPVPQDIGGKMSLWAQNVADDIKYGTDRTGVGTVLKKMGAHGVYNGNSEKVGDFMASLPLGLAKTAEGAGQVMGGSVGGGMLNGVGKMVSGAAQAATMPTAFGEAEPVETGLAKAASVFPSAARAAKNFEDVLATAGNVPIDVGIPAEKALELRRMESHGGQPVKVAEDFLDRILNPKAPPLTFQEARDFYSNASELSAGERMNLNSRTLNKVVDFTRALDSSLSDAAGSVGKGQQYRDAMNEWHTVKGIERVKDNVVDLAKSKALQAALGGGAAYGLYKAIEK